MKSPSSRHRSAAAGRPHHAGRCDAPAPHADTPGSAGGEWMLQRADSITSFLTQQRSRSAAASSRTAWAVTGAQLAAEGDAASKQLEATLQAAAAAGAGSGCEEELMQLQQQLSSQAADARAERQQATAQVLDLAQLLRRAACMRAAAADTGEAGALSSLQQELQWLQEDTQHSIRELAAAAAELIRQLPPAATATNTMCSSGSSSCRRASSSGPADAAGGLQGASSLEAPLQPLASLLDAGGSGGGWHAADATLQELMSSFPLAPDSLKQELREEHAALQQQHQQHLRAQQQWSSPPDGLTQDEHLLFVWLRQQILSQAASAPSTAASGAGRLSTRRTTSTQPGTKAAGANAGGSTARGCVKAAVVSQLVTRMPGKTRQELEAHNAWFDAACQMQRRLDAAADDRQRAHASFLAEAEQRLQEAAAATANAAESAAACLSTAVGRQLLHEQLASISAVKQEQQEAHAAQEEAVAAEAAPRAAAEGVAAADKAAAQRAQVGAYKQALLQQQLEAAQHAEQQRQEAVAVAEAAIAAARPAVEARQADALLRQQQQQEEQQARRAAAAARRQRLAAIAEAMAPQLERDPQRVLQQTAASSAAPPATGAAFRPVHGFTVQQVVSDPRFRFVEAVRQAGLLNGAAGQAGYLKAAMARLG